MLEQEILISRAFTDGMRKYLGAVDHPGGIGSSKINTQSVLTPLPALSR